MLFDYRAGAGFEGMYEYEPPGGDDSSIATGLPDACLVSDPSVVLGKPDPDDPDANPIWSPDQGSCQATFATLQAAFRPTPSTARFAPQPLMPAIWSCASSATRHGAFASTAKLQAALPKRGDGLIVVPVPQGAVDLTVDWTRSPDVVGRPLGERLQRAPAHRPVVG